MEAMSIDGAVRVLLGFMVLLAGRNIFWLFIAAIGFLAGIELAQALLADQSTWLALVAGIGMGLVGAVLAIVYERVAFALAGFYAATFLVITYADRIGFTDMPAIMPYVAGVFGALLAVLLTDWSIIVLSALAGAAAIVSAFALQPGVEAVSFLALALIGILVQWSMLASRRRRV
jgi:hypothetical protein